MTEVPRLSVRLTRLQGEIANQNYINPRRLNGVIAQALQMEEEIDNLDRVRTNDPTTSYYGGTLDDLKQAQRDVYQCFRIYGPMDDETLKQTYEIARFQHGWKKLEGSGPRTRANELVKLGILEIEPGPRRGTSPSGRKAQRWQVKWVAR